MAQTESSALLSDQRSATKSRFSRIRLACKEVEDENDDEVEDDWGSQN